MRRRLAMGLAFGIAAALSGHLTAAQAPQLGFFITSVGPGKGADLGGRPRLGLPARRFDGLLESLLGAILLALAYRGGDSMSRETSGEPDPLAIGPSQIRP